MLRLRSLFVPLLGAALAAPLGAQAPTAPASLLVVHVATDQGQPLRDALVTVGGVLEPARTNARGDAWIPGVPPGNRLVEVRHTGFAYLRVGTDFVGGDTVRRELRMQSQPVELPGVVATSWGRSMKLRNNGFYDRQRRGMGTFMTQDQIEAIHPLHTNDIFRHTRGAMVVRDRKGVESVVSSRGQSIGAKCPMQLYVDNVPLLSRDPRDQQEAINGVPWNDIEALEIYTGPATIPAEYNVTGNACGVILFWTGRNAQ
jgi:hypothetical protein